MATRVASIVADIGINTGKFDKGVNSVLKSLGLMKGDFAKFGAAVGIAGVAIGVIATQMKKAVDITVTYADEVRTLSSVTNQSAETTSRMIQVLDDYKISAEQAGSAARFLAKEGLSLNVETLAKLSDEYKNLNSGQERAEFLMKKFGKAGQDFALIMEQGSEAILKQGDAVNKGLILSEKQLQAARDLEIAQDEYNDTLQEFYVIAGTRIIPTLNNMVEGLTNAEDFTRRLRISIEGIEASPIDSATQSYVAMALAIENAERAAQGLPPIVEDVGAAIGALSSAEESFLTSTREMTPQAVAEFITLETKIAQVKKMIAEGASFNVIVNFLAGKTIMVDPGKMSNIPGDWRTTNNNGNTRTEVASGEAVGGPIGNGYTLVGEVGPELISPSGMVINAHNTRRMLGRGWGGRRMAVGANMIPDPWEPRNTPSPEPDAGSVFWIPGGGGMYSPGSPASGDYISPWGGGGGSGGGVGGSSAVLRTASEASKAARSASISVDVTAQMATQQARAAATTVALLKSIDQRLAEMPRAIRDAVQQAI